MVRPPPGVSSASDRAAHRLHQPAGHRKPEPHAGAPRCVAIAAGTARRSRPWPPRALPCPRSTTRICSRLAGRRRVDDDLGVRVLERVLQDVGQHPVQQARVGGGRRQGVVHADPHAVRAEQWSRRPPTRRPSMSTALILGTTDPLCSRDMSRRLATRPVSRSVDSSIVSSRSARSAVAEHDVGLAQAGRGGLDARQRGAQVVRHGGEQGGPARGCPWPAPAPRGPAAPARRGAAARRRVTRRRRPAGGPRRTSTRPSSTSTWASSTEARTDAVGMAARSNPSVPATRVQGSRTLSRRTTAAPSTAKNSTAWRSRAGQLVAFSQKGFRRGREGAGLPLGRGGGRSPSLTDVDDRGDRRRPRGGRRAGRRGSAGPRS